MGEPFKAIKSNVQLWEMLLMETT